MSTFFFAGRTRCALDGTTLERRDQAALLPAVALWPGPVDIAREHFEQPVSRWVRRTSWSSFEHRDRWVDAAAQAWATHRSPAATLHVREGVVALRSTTEGSVHDLQLLVELSVGLAEFDTLTATLEQLHAGAAHGRVHGSFYEYEFTREDAALRLDVVQNAERFEVVVVPPERVAVWLNCIAQYSASVGDAK